MWSLKGKKILLVDDYGEMRSMLSGYGADDITSAATGEEAIEMIGNRRFDIILCDYNLGDGKDGQQVLEEVKHRGYLSYPTLFIMITAESTAFMVIGALEYQPDEYLSKPVTATVLQARLQKLMEKKEGLQPIAKALESRDHTRVIELCYSSNRSLPSMALMSPPMTGWPGFTARTTTRKRPSMF
jgi:CheY-like chemotaxis protein